MVDAPAHGGPVAAAAPPADAGYDRVRAVADAILYEGYLLYPYRRSSPKNRVRWQFGIVAPRDWVEANGPVTPGVAGSAESWWQQTECLVLAEPDAVVRVCVRYLQVQAKCVQRRGEDGRYEPVDSLEADGTLHLTFDEAVPREVHLSVPLAQLLAGGRTFQVGAPGGEDVEAIAGGAGRVVRRRYAVEAATTLSAEAIGTGSAYRLRVRTENTRRSAARAMPREQALRHALIAAHTFLSGSAVRYLSLLDPPQWAEPHARACRNLHTFPVLAGDLAGDDGRAQVMLSSPIILPDHPQVAPESPGDLHDAAEIDELLCLRTALLSDEEKREARATDPRAAEILDRVESMPPEILAGLHGAIRSLRPRPAASAPEQPSSACPPASPRPWWEEGGDDGLSPATDGVLVDGIRLAKGSGVRLRPRGRGADAQDMFLTGRTARVAAVFHDVDGSVQLAVTLDDDPGADLNGWYGRYCYFRPDEVEPLPAAPDEEIADGCHRAAEA